ncbi:protein-export chaperone SecB [Rickettsiales bacterium LUAb2]
MKLNSDSKVDFLHSYIKDLSLEVIDPLVLVRHKNEGEEVILKIEPLAINHRKLNDNVYEIVAKCEIFITKEDKNVMILQIEYGGLFNIEDNSDNLKKLIYVDCSNILYPFLRSEVANLSLSTGGNTIILPYINFAEQFNSIN